MPVKLLTKPMRLLEELYQHIDKGGGAPAILFHKSGWFAKCGTLMEAIERELTKARKVVDGRENRIIALWDSDDEEVAEVVQFARKRGVEVTIFDCEE